MWKEREREQQERKGQITKMESAFQQQRERAVVLLYSNPAHKWSTER
jgi:hypothetical protein